MIKIKHIHSEAARTSHTLCSRLRLLIHHVHADTVPVFTLMPVRGKIPLSACTPLTQRPPREGASTHISPSTHTVIPHPPQSCTRYQWPTLHAEQGDGDSAAPVVSLYSSGRRHPPGSCVFPGSAHSFTSTSQLSLMV